MTARRCPSCGAEVPEAGRHCVDCGRPLGPPVVPLAPCDRRGPTLEVLRRLLLFVSLLGGLSALLYQVPHVVVLREHDFATEYLRGETAQPITRFIDERLARAPVQGGSEWAALLAEVRSSARRLDGVPAKAFGAKHPLGADGHDLVIVQQGPERAYLGQRRLTPPEARRQMGVSLWTCRPALPLAIGCGCLGLLSLLLLRWRRRRAAVRYRALEIAMLDGLGYTIAAGSSYFLLEALRGARGNPLGMVLFLSVMGLVALGVAAHAECMRVQILPDRLRSFTLYGAADFPFDSLVEAGTTREPPHRKLGLAMIALAPLLGLSWLWGLRLMMADDCLVLQNAAGQRVRILTRFSTGMDELYAALRAAGVSLPATPRR